MKINDKLANGLYLGASTIPGAGVGLFTGLPINGGIPVCEYKGEIFEDKEDSYKRYEYTERSGFKTRPLLYTQVHPPTGFSIDCHPALCKEEMGLGGFINDAKNHGDRVKDLEKEEDMEKRMKMSLEAGYNVTWFIVPNEPLLYLTSIRTIEQNEELFVNYGDAYWAPFAEAEEIANAAEEKKSQKEEVIEVKAESEEESRKEEKKDELASA